jgi:hypothetical protein
MNHAPEHPSPRITELTGFVLLAAILSAIAFWAQYNPSFGARLDFVRYHYATVEQFRTLPLDIFLQKMLSASSPLYYMLMAVLPLDAQGVRAWTASFHVVNAALVFIHCARSGLPRQTRWVAGLAFLISPFQLGPSLWAHPETLATTLILAAIMLNQQGRSSLAAIVIGIATGCRQTALGVLGAMGLRDIDRQQWRPLVIKAGLALGILAYLHHQWGALLPPTFNDHESPNTRSGLVAAVLLLLAVQCAALPSEIRHVRRTLIWTLCLLPIVIGLYNACPPFERGGFIFSIVDGLEARYLPFALISPMVISLIFAMLLPSILDEPWLLLSIFGMAITLGVSKVFYVKYVDFYAWPLGMLALQMLPTTTLRQTRLLTSLSIWSIANLLFVTVRYQQVS